MIAPCEHCPFRRGQSYLRPERAMEIALTHADEGGGAIFSCHETTRGRKRDREHCAGALLFALRLGVRTQAMQIGDRLGHYRLDLLRGRTLVYRSVEEMVRGHARSVAAAAGKRAGWPGRRP